MAKFEVNLNNIQIPILSGWVPSDNWVTNIGFLLLVLLLV